MSEADAIAMVTAERGITRSVLLSKNRHKHVVAARRKVAWLLRDSGYSLYQIGKAIKRDHTSVIYLLKDHVPRLKYALEWGQYLVHRGAGL